MTRSDTCSDVLLFFSLLLVAATATAQVDFFWDVSSARMGYRSPDRMPMELEVAPLTLMGSSIPLYLESSPLQAAGSPGNQSGQFHLDMESLTFLNLTAGYVLVFGGHLMLASQLQFSLVRNMEESFGTAPALFRQLPLVEAGSTAPHGALFARRAVGIG